MVGEVLGKGALKKAILAGELVVSPVLDLDDQIGEGSIDLRLGPKFITTRRTQYYLMDPRTLDKSKARHFQSRVDLVFGHQFTLHPGQLILAGTFEFLALPESMCAYVLSRSRYGRAGLLAATATYVHPGWKGCLTLELYNFGDVPILLTCGAPIAQLVVHRCGEVGTVTPKPAPVGPEFPDLTQESFWEKAEMFSRLWRNGGLQHDGASGAQGRPSENEASGGQLG